MPYLLITAGLEQTIHLFKAKPHFLLPKFPSFVVIMLGLLLKFLILLAGERRDTSLEAWLKWWCRELSVRVELMHMTTCTAINQYDLCEEMVIELLLLKLREK